MGSVFDVRVAQPQLKSPRIMPRVSEQMAACMAQHVRMSVGKARAFTRRCHHLANIAPGHRPTIAFTSKHKRPGSSATYLTQGSEFVALDWVNASNPSFQSPDVQMRSGEINLIPLKVNGFADP
jgi:hypothetical protein